MKVNDVSVALHPITKPKSAKGPTALVAASVATTQDTLSRIATRPTRSERNSKRN